MSDARQNPKIDDDLKPLLAYIEVTRDGITSGLFWELPLREINAALLRHLDDMERLIKAYADLRKSHAATERQAEAAFKMLRRKMGMPVPTEH